MEYVEINIASREELGSAAVGRMRRAGTIPAVLYGMGRPNLNISVAGTDFKRLFKSGSHLVHLRMGDKTRSAILREVQFDALTDQLLHADFTRVSDDVAIEDSCVVLFKGRAKGTTEGGNFQVLQESVTVLALPRALPGKITVDISDLAVGDAIRAGDLPFEDGVELISPVTDTLCQVSAEALATEDEEEGETEAAAEASTEG